MRTFGGVVLALVIAELLGWLRPVADWVVERGSHRLADPQARERYAAEWKAELDSLDGRRLTQLLTAVWMFHRSAGVNVALGDAAPQNRRPWRAVERVLNVSLAATILVVVVPVLCVLALAVSATSPGPVLIRERRTGRDGRSYEYLNFRTARTGDLLDSEELMQHIPDGRGPHWLPDPRVTKIGRFLRASSLDELPELWNVLKGNTSLVVFGDGEPGSSEDAL